MEEKQELNGPTFTAVELNRSSAAPPFPAAPHAEPKKKRGRPRKYAADGSVVALSPMPISASIPFAGGEFPGWKKSVKKKKKLDFEIPGPTTMEYSSGASFTPHMITVNSGEDIMMKVISFSQQGSKAICVLAANGTVSNVTFRQSDSCGGTLTYEGRFEILSLQGSFMLSDNGLTKTRTGGLSVSLAGPDGRVLGGGLAGGLVAAGPVQIVIGSFVPGNQSEQRQKKQKYEQTITFGAVQANNPISEQRYEMASFHRENATNLNFGRGSSKSVNDEDALYLSEEDSREQR